jgi:hypothetical protein
MIDLFVATDLAVRGTRAAAHSARPDAPVVAHRTERERWEVRTRAGLAARLNSLASALEPTRRQERSTVCS